MKDLEWLENVALFLSWAYTKLYIHVPVKINYCQNTDSRYPP